MHFAKELFKALVNLRVRAVANGFIIYRALFCDILLFGRSSCRTIHQVLLILVFRLLFTFVDIDTIGASTAPARLKRLA